MRNNEMVASLKWLFILGLTSIYAQEPRKKNFIGRFSFDDPILFDKEDASCSAGTCLKRSPGQDEFGPFWANRGKREPSYIPDKLFAQEPRWILVRRDDRNENEPFYVTRGKKYVNDNNFQNALRHLWRPLGETLQINRKNSAEVPHGHDRNEDIGNLQ